MPVITKPCFGTGLIKPGQTKNFNLTAAQRRPIYEYMRKRYLDNNFGFDKTIEEMTREYGLPRDVGRRFFSEVILGGAKRGPIKTRDMLKVEAQRKKAKFQAEEFIRRSEMGLGGKVASFAGQMFRSSLTGGHVIVLPGTHAGGLLWRPETWGIWLKGYGDTLKALSDVGYEQAEREIEDDPKYPRNVASGLRIKPEERPAGIISDFITKKPGWGRKGWVGVRGIRQGIHNQNMNRISYPPELEQAMSDSLAPIANHATSVVEDPHFWGKLGKLQFSPQITAGQIYRGIFDPAQTARTLLHSNPKDALTGLWKMATFRKAYVTDPELAAALVRTRNAAEYFLMRGTALNLNQALLQAMGSPHQINMNDPTRSDYQLFKTSTGLVIKDRGAVDMMRAIGQMIHIAWAEDARARHGKGLFDAEVDVIKQRALYKMDPNIESYGELILGEDIFGRPLPKFLQMGRYFGMQERPGTPSKPPYTLNEWAFSHAPLALNGPVADMYKEIENGIGPLSATALFNFSLGLFVHGLLGGGTHYETEQQAMGLVPQKAPTRVHKYKGAL